MKSHAGRTKRTVSRLTWLSAPTEKRKVAGSIPALATSEIAHETRSVAWPG